MNLFLLLAVTLNAQSPDGLNLNLPSNWTVKRNVGGRHWHLLFPPDLLRQDDGKSRELFFAGLLPATRNIDDETLLSGISLLPFFQHGVSKFTGNTVVNLAGGRARMVTFDQPGYATEPSEAAALAVELPKGGVFVLSVVTPKHVLYRRKNLLQTIAKDVTHETGGAPVDYESAAVEEHRAFLAGKRIVSNSADRVLDLTLRGNSTYAAVLEIPGDAPKKDEGTWRVALQAGKLFLQMRRAGSWSTAPLERNGSSLTVYGAPAQVTPLTGDGASPFDRTPTGLLVQKTNGWEVLGQIGRLTVLTPPGWTSEGGERYFAGTLLGARNTADPNITKILAGTLPYFTERPAGANTDTIATKTAERIVIEGSLRIQHYTLESGEKPTALRVYLRDLPKGGVAFLYAVGDAARIDGRTAILERMSTQLGHESEGLPIVSATPALAEIAKRLSGQKVEIPQKSGSTLVLNLLANGKFRSPVSVFGTGDAVATGTWRVQSQGMEQYLFLQDALTGVVYTQSLEMAGSALKFDGLEAKLSPLPTAGR